MSRQPNITIYGSMSCPDTQGAMAFLDDRGIPYDFKDVDESPELAPYIASLNQGKKVMPTIQIENEFYFNPSEAVLNQVIETASATT